MNPKFKAESYAAFGGLNTRFSPYVLTPMEFLDLQNFDFQQPGSLTQRWGTTQYVGQTAPGGIASLFEYTQLNGASYVLFSYSGAIFAGATTGQSQGLSLTVQSATLTSWAVVGVMSLSGGSSSMNGKINTIPLGAYYQGISTNPVYGIGQLGIGLTFSYNGTSVVISSVTQSDNTLDYAVLDNFLFAADGNKFFKYDGVTTTPIGLPPPLWVTNAYGGPLGTSSALGVMASASTTGFGFQYGPSFGTYYLFASYVNNRGFEGNIFPLMALVANTQDTATTVVSNAASPLYGITSGVLLVSMMLHTPIQYGISAINIYCYYDIYNASIGQTYVSQGSTVFVSNLMHRFWNIGPPGLMQTISASGSTQTAFAMGASDQVALQNNAIGPIENPTINTYLPLGFSLLSSSPATDGNGYFFSKEEIFTNYYPRYIETYQNRLFLAGFSSTPSTVWFSDVAEPEGYAPDFNFEVRTNDADVITAMQSYSTRLYIFKKNSFHVLSGDNPNNFFLQEVSDQYGCLNNKSAAVFGETMAFLDRKGVITFNGSSIQVLSAKVQSYFDNMNYNLALTTACMGHDKLRNQLLVAIPSAAASTKNDIILVYDYVTNAWTTYTGLNPSAFAVIQGRLTTKFPFFGDTQGRINYFGPSFIKDNGATMTAYLKTRFIHDIGDSVQKQFRRLYLNGDQQGQTLSIPIGFYQDYGTSKVLAATLNLGSFQERIDFGISAKALAFDATIYPTVQALNIHGFTIEQRMQRRV